MRFDLTDLRLFISVVDAGSITHGAVEVGLSLPAASERLRDMEAAGEVTLLDRGRRGVVPTEAGEALAHHARTILHQMAQMRGDIGQYAKGIRASVRILANTASMSELLPAKLAPWMAGNPQIDIDLKERGSSEIARSVAAGFAEIGVLSTAYDTGALSLRPFAIDHLVVVASGDHPVARDRQVGFADLLDYPFIGLTSGPLQDHIDRQAARMGIRLKTRIRLRSFDGICHMAGAGAGIGIVPEAAAIRCRRSTGIKMARLSDPWGTRRLSLCVRGERDLTAPARALFEHLSARKSS